MSRSWTSEQLEAINSETQNILVSAGAGSGKTAVLTERVTKLLSKKININELLVLTFTNAAAAEMKERIRKAIKGNPDLKEQLDLLDSAYITTFDSYALSLVKKYHYLLNVSSNVSIVNDAALKLEKYKIIESVLEEKYKERKDDFVALIGKFCLKDDNDLKDLLYELNEKFDLIIDKEEFLNNYTNNLDDSKIELIWNDYYQFIVDKLNQFKDLYYDIENSLETTEDETLFEDFANELENIINASDFDTIAKNINVNFGKFRKSKNISEVFLINKKKMAAIRDDIKKVIDCDNKKDILNALKNNFIYEREIIDIVREVNEKITSLKFNNEMFEFIDIAKMAIKVVRDNEYVRNDIKNSIKEIMLDEYQDTSDIQETLISYISNDNVYMVGDIKQSIYRFRNANPRIFSDKYDLYTKDSSKGKVINLMRNFRSRKEVLDDINLLFNVIMDKEFGGVDYSKGHEFAFGNLSYDSNVFETQSNHLEIYSYTYDKELNCSRDETEAFIIGQDIKSKIENKYMIYDKDKNIKREMEYGDITILIDRKGAFDVYQKVFEYLQIPVSSYKNSNLTFSDELLCFKNIYRLIVKYYNKEFDSEFKHSFMSVSRSFLFEMDDNKLFNIINNNLFYDNEVYLALKEIIDNYDCLSLTKINSKIIKDLDVFYKVSKCSDIEDINAIIHYICNLIGDLNDMNYTLEEVVEYFDSVVDKEFKIELPVRKNAMNSVKIMTIHGSKGLEFNLCYFSGFNKKFSEFDSKKKFIYDDKYGIIMPLFIGDEKYTNIAKHLYIDKYYKEEISEKIRLLYVALSRAKEKMIIVSDFNDRDNENKLMKDTRSFYDLIKYSQRQLSNYFKYLDLKDYEVTQKYKFYKSLKDFTGDEYKVIDCKTISVMKKETNLSSYSKKETTLIDSDTISVLNLGNKIHKVLQVIDFKTPNINALNLSNNEKRLIDKFLKCDLLNNLENCKIYKEYEFMYEINDEFKHGFIDLMIENDSHINIIDYKLSNIGDEAYIKQLNGYRDYIKTISDKEVNIYLYSLFKGEYVKL